MGFPAHLLESEPSQISDTRHSESRLLSMLTSSLTLFFFFFQVLFLMSTGLGNALPFSFVSPASWAASTLDAAAKEFTLFRAY